VNRDAGTPAADAPRQAALLQTVRAVAWSFFGVRRRSGLERDAERLDPVHVVVGALLGVALFVAALLLLIGWVVRNGVAG
jgi:hypothetical protein